MCTLPDLCPLLVTYVFTRYTRCTRNQCVQCTCSHLPGNLSSHTEGICTFPHTHTVSICTSTHTHSGQMYLSSRTVGICTSPHKHSGHMYLSSHTQWAYIPLLTHTVGIYTSPHTQWAYAGALGDAQHSTPKSPPHTQPGVVHPTPPPQAHHRTHSLAHHLLIT